MKINKDESHYLKGIAIILMFTHHLFAFPERIIHPSMYIPVLDGFSLELYLGMFGKICVAIFIFLSGYGFGIIGEKDITYYKNKIIKFIFVYWFYFVVFVPIGFFFFYDVTLFGSRELRFRVDAVSIIKNMVFLSSSFNEEWWFAQPYIIFVLLVPFLNKFKSWSSASFVFLGLCLIGFGFVLKEINIDTPLVSLKSLLLWQFPFILGYALSITSLDYDFYLEWKWVVFFITLMSLVVVVVLFMFLASIGLVVASPFFILACLCIKRQFSFRGVALGFLGKYSLPMWLIHSFFCYYYFQDYIYAPRYSFFVLLNLTVTSFCCAVLLEKVRMLLQSKIMKALAA